MPESSILPDDQGLAERLRDEAAHGRPAFSHALHERVMAAVADPRPAFGTSEFARPRRYWKPALAAAAAILLCAVPLAWRGFSPQSAPEVQPPGQLVTNVPPVQIPDESAVIGVTFNARDALLLVESNLAAHQWAYLDQDARTAAEGLMREVPFDLGQAE